MLNKLAQKSWYQITAVKFDVKIPLLINNHDSKKLTELTVICANNVSIDTHQVVYPACSYVTSGQKKSSRDSDMLNGYKHRTMMSFDH